MSRFLRRLTCLSAAERRLRIEAVSVLALVRLGLWILPFRPMGAVTAKTAQRRRRGRAVTTEQISIAIQSCARLIPGASCLTQALAAEVLMKRRGYACTLRIGVARDGGGPLRAHAWLESKGVAVVGGGLSDYTLLPTFESLRT